MHIGLRGAKGHWDIEFDRSVGLDFLSFDNLVIHLQDKMDTLGFAQYHDLEGAVIWDSLNV